MKSEMNEINNPEINIHILLVQLNQSLLRYRSTIGIIDLLWKQILLRRPHCCFAL